MDMAEFDKVTLVIQKRMEEISLILMKHENKDFCLAKVHPNSWHYYLIVAMIRNIDLL